MSTRKLRNRDQPVNYADMHRGKVSQRQSLDTVPETPSIRLKVGVTPARGVLSELVTPAPSTRSKAARKLLASLQTPAQKVTVVRADPIFRSASTDSAAVTETGQQERRASTRVRDTTWTPHGKDFFTPSRTNQSRSRLVLPELTQRSIDMIGEHSFVVPRGEIQTILDHAQQITKAVMEIEDATGRGSYYAKMADDSNDSLDPRSDHEDIGGGAAAILSGAFSVKQDLSPFIDQAALDVTVETAGMSRPFTPESEPRGEAPKPSPNPKKPESEICEEVMSPTFQIGQYLPEESAVLMELAEFPLHSLHAFSTSPVLNETKSRASLGSDYFWWDDKDMERAAEDVSRSAFPGRNSIVKNSAHEEFSFYLQPVIDPKVKESIESFCEEAGRYGYTKQSEMRKFLVHTVSDVDFQMKTSYEAMLVVQLSGSEMLRKFESQYTGIHLPQVTRTPVVPRLTLEGLPNSSLLSTTAKEVPITELGRPKGGSTSSKVSGSQSGGGDKSDKPSDKQGNEDRDDGKKDKDKQDGSGSGGKGQGGSSAQSKQTNERVVYGTYTPHGSEQKVVYVDEVVTITRQLDASFKKLGATSVCKVSSLKTMIVSLLKTLKDTDQTMPQSVDTSPRTTPRNKNFFMVVACLFDFLFEHDSKKVCIGDKNNFSTDFKDVDIMTLLLNVSRNESVWPSTPLFLALACSRDQKIKLGVSPLFVKIVSEDCSEFFKNTLKNKNLADLASSARKASTKIMDGKLEASSFMKILNMFGASFHKRYESEQQKQIDEEKSKASEITPSREKAQASAKNYSVIDVENTSPAPKGSSCIYSGRIAFSGTAKHHHCEENKNLFPLLCKGKDTVKSTHYVCRNCATLMEKLRPFYEQSMNVSHSTSHCDPIHKWCLCELKPRDKMKSKDLLNYASVGKLASTVNQKASGTVSFSDHPPLQQAMKNYDKNMTPRKIPVPTMSSSLNDSSASKKSSDKPKVQEAAKASSPAISSNSEALQDLDLSSESVGIKGPVRRDSEENAVLVLTSLSSAVANDTSAGVAVEADDSSSKNALVDQSQSASKDAVSGSGSSSLHHLKQTAFLQVLKENDAKYAAQVSGDQPLSVQESVDQGSSNKEGPKTPPTPPVSPLDADSIQPAFVAPAVTALAATELASAAPAATELVSVAPAATAPATTASAVTAPAATATASVESELKNEGSPDKGNSSTVDDTEALVDSQKSPDKRPRAAKTNYIAEVLTALDSKHSTINERTAICLFFGSTCQPEQESLVGICSPFLRYISDGWNPLTDQLVQSFMCHVLDVIYSTVFAELSEEWKLKYMPTQSDSTEDKSKYDFQSVKRYINSFDHSKKHPKIPLVLLKSGNEKFEQAMNKQILGVAIGNVKTLAPLIFFLDSLHLPYSIAASSTGVSDDLFVKKNSFKIKEDVTREFQCISRKKTSARFMIAHGLPGDSYTRILDQCKDFIRKTVNDFNVDSDDVKDMMCEEFIQSASFAPDDFSDFFHAYDAKRNSERISVPESQNSKSEVVLKISGKFPQKCSTTPAAASQAAADPKPTDPVPVATLQAAQASQPKVTAVFEVRAAPLVAAASEVVDSIAELKNLQDEAVTYMETHTTIFEMSHVKKTWVFSNPKQSIFVARGFVEELNSGCYDCTPLYIGFSNITSVWDQSYQRNRFLSNPMDPKRVYIACNVQSSGRAAYVEVTLNKEYQITAVHDTHTKVYMDYLFSLNFNIASKISDPGSMLALNDYMVLRSSNVDA